MKNKPKEFIYICDKCGDEIISKDNVDFIICNECSNKIIINSRNWSKNHNDYDRKGRKFDKKKGRVYFIITMLILLLIIRTCIHIEQEKTKEQGKEIIKILSN